jgi:condensin complex subunit 2
MMKITKSDALNYSKKAKKVDVKQLKDHIWTAFTQSCDAQSEPTPFTRLVSDVARVYPAETRVDVTIPFYFICLLHLANENNLAITDCPTMNDLFVRQDA